MPEAPPKKINADSFKRGLSLEEKVESNAKKIALIKSTINLRKENVDLRLEKIEDDVDNTNNDLMDGLHSITEALVGVKAILADQVKERLKERRDARKENERLKKKRREDELENKKEKGEGPLKAVGGVAKDIFGRLKKFLTSIVLGSAIINLLKWLKDPKNLDNLKNFAKFLQDHGGKIIATLVALTAINFVGGLIGIGGTLKGILSLVGLKGFAVAAAAAGVVTAAIGAGIETKRYMDDFYGPDLQGRKSFNEYQQGMINRVTKDGKEKALADEKAKLAKYLYENPDIGRWDPMKLEMERAIKHTEEGRYDKFDPVNMDPKDLAIFEQVEPEFESARKSWKKFRSIAVEIDSKVNNGVDPSAPEIEELKKEQQIPKEALVKSLNNLIQIRKSLSNNGKNWFDNMVENGTNRVAGELFTKRWENAIKPGGLTQQKKGFYLDNLLKSGMPSAQGYFEWLIGRAKSEGVKSNLKVDKKGETLESEKQKLLPPSNTDKVNESVVEIGKEETIARLREQKKNLNLWERLSGVGGEINEEIYRLETGKEMDHRWKQSYERKVDEGKVGTVLGGFEDRGAKVEPTTKLIDSESYSTNKEVAARFDMKTGKAYINDQEVSTKDYNKFQSLSKEEQVNRYGIDKKISNANIDKKISNANIDKSNQTSVKSSGGIESVASNKTPKINLLPITGGEQSKIASSSGNFGNNSVVFSSEDPTQSNFAIQGIYNVSPA